LERLESPKTALFERGVEERRVRKLTLTCIHVPMPVIVGAPRSGTTLLRLMLDSHPDVAIPPETGFLAVAAQFSSVGDELRRQFFDTVTSFPPEAPAWSDFGILKDEYWTALQEIVPFSVAEGYRAFYRTYAARFGKGRWGDKTPTYCMHMKTIEQVLPEAYFIHVIRDGRDVALSLRQMWFSPGHDIETQAKYWSDCVTAARRHGARCRKYLEVRFESIVQETKAVLKTVCEFIALPYSAEMLTYHRRALDRLVEHRDRVRADGSLVVSHADRLRQQALTMQPPQPGRAGSWKGEMSHQERRRFDAVAGDLLRELGYVDSASGPQD
jgi:Sulfotransferase family